MSLREQASQVLQENWRAPGFTCPNPTTYPWLWLWDSCFHSVVWSALGHPERAVSELELALSGQHDDGFVPHLLYLDGFGGHEEFWWTDSDRAVDAVVSTSSITQPPVYGHTVAELLRAGVTLDAAVVQRARSGLDFLLRERRRSPEGLIEIVHPWESGCDDSPRWDDVTFAGLTDVSRSDPPSALFFERKGALLSTVQRSASGSPVANDAFAVGSVAFSAITAWSAAELGAMTGDAALLSASEQLQEGLAARWDADLATWVDDGPSAGGSGRVRTSEALLPILLPQSDDVVEAVAAQLVDTGAFGGEFGPAQVHRDEPTRSKGSYWRGPSWPQLDYLLWWGLTRAATRGSATAGRAAEVVSAGTTRGAVRSAFSEYWDSDDGGGGGARPQSWSTLPVLMQP